MKVGEALKVTRDDIQDFPGDTISIIMDLQKEGWRAQRSNRNHVMLLAPDGVTKHGYESPRRKRRKELEANKKAEADTEQAEKILDAAVEGAREAGRAVGRMIKNSVKPIDTSDATKFDPEFLSATTTNVDPEVVRTEDMEFIDSRDSWVIDHHNIIDRRIGTLEQILDAAGLRMEIRVWKPKNS